MTELLYKYGNYGAAVGDVTLDNGVIAKGYVVTNLKTGVEEFKTTLLFQAIDACQRSERLVNEALAAEPQPATPAGSEKWPEAYEATLTPPSDDTSPTVA